MRPRCIHTGKYGEYHHLLTQKAYPELKDEPWNKIPLCRELHTLWHMKGTNYMTNYCPTIECWMRQRGWVFDKEFKGGKWWHEEASRIIEIYRKNQIRFT